MKTTDEAADSTLSELFDDLCHSSFQPLRTTVALIGKRVVGEDLRRKCRRSDLPDDEKRRAIIDTVRSNGEARVFQTFVTVLEWDPGNTTNVNEVKGLFSNSFVLCFLAVADRGSVEKNEKIS